MTFNDLTKNYLVICFDEITDIYSIVDAFCKDFDEFSEPFLYGNKLKSIKHNKSSKTLLPPVTTAIF